MGRMIMLKVGDRVSVCESNLKYPLHREDWHGRIHNIVQHDISLCEGNTYKVTLWATIEDTSDPRRKKYDRLISQLRVKK
jgi:hypothetical protein